MHRLLASLVLLPLVIATACAPGLDSEETDTDEATVSEDGVSDDGVSKDDDDAAPSDACDDAACGTPCEAPFANALPTACDGKGACVVQPTCEDKNTCEGVPCGTPCDAPYANPLPTACDGHGACVPQPTCVADVDVDCNLGHAACDAATPVCKDGETPSVVGACYGPCVPVSSCSCDPADPYDCPEGWVCWANTGHCGPYVD